MTQPKCVHECLTIRVKTFIPYLIQKAFKNTKVHPLNPNIATAKVFAPGQTRSHKVHVPLSYPEPHLQDEADDIGYVDGWGSDWGNRAKVTKERMRGTIGLGLIVAAMVTSWVFTVIVMASQDFTAAVDIDWFPATSMDDYNTQRSQPPQEPPMTYR